MKIIILEDEIPAFNKLSNQLLAYAPGSKIIAWYRSIKDAINEKEKFNNCDLIISDIELLDGTSIELFKQINISQPIIFCTAYNKYLQDAFNTNGIAYLVKPYSKDDFHKVMQKFEQLFGKKIESTWNTKSISILENLLSKSIKNYKKRFSIKKKEQIIIKMVEDAVYFQAFGDFCILFDNKGKKHNINYKISELETILDPTYFFRINRSEIINIAYLEKTELSFRNKMNIQLTTNISLTTSGSRTPNFRLWMEGNT